MQLLRPFTMVTAFFRTFVMPFKVLSRWFSKIGKIKIPPWVRYFLHAIVLITLLVLFEYLFLRFRLHEYISTTNDLVKYGFPIIVALLCYAGFRLFLYILSQLPSAQVAFPDIEEAVNEGLAALNQAGINVADVPLFLVVGFTPNDERAIAESALIGKDVRVTDPDLALHWYGDHKGIWVTLTKVSAITAQCTMARSSGGRRQAAADPVPAQRQFETQAVGVGGGDGQFNTLGAVGAARFDTMAVGVMENETISAPEPIPTAARRLDADERDRCDRRVRFFVELLKEARYPVCPVNGILLGIPYSWLTSPGLAQNADVIKIDMYALQQSLGVKCLSIAVFTGIEQVPEFRTYINRLDKAQLERRFGCGFPSPSLYSPGNEDFDVAHAWLMNYFERQVFELFQQKLGDPTNGDLFRLLDRVRKFRPNFLRVLKHAFPDDVEEPIYLGGLYFASVEPSGGVRIPFFDGIVARLLREHDDVIGWNEQALAEDRRMHRLARAFYIAAAVIVILSAILILVSIIPS